MQGSRDNNDNKKLDVAKTAKKFKSNDDFAFKMSLVTIFISVLISFGIIFGMNSNLMPGNFKTKLSNILNKAGKVPGLSLLGVRQTILFVGVDSNGKHSDPFKSTRSDSIIVVSIDPITKTANAVSIPRDSKVFIPEGHGLDKINASHAFGGPDLLIKTIKDNFGIQVDHYVAIDYAGIKELVGAIGGIPINVEKRMHYTDRTAGLYIDLHPGYQVLDSNQAIGYLRFRHDAIGDIGRTQRQQQFMRSLALQLQNPKIITRIPELIQLSTKYIRTDMNFYQLSRLAATAKTINLNDVQTATLPGRPSRFGRISYWILDTEKSQEIIDRLIFRDDSAKKDSKLTVSLLYPISASERALSIRDTLQQSGFDVVCSRKTKKPKAEILSHSNYGTLEEARIIRSKVPELQKSQFTLSPDNYLCSESDLTIVLAQ